MVSASYIVEYYRHTRVVIFRLRKLIPSQRMHVFHYLPQCQGLSSPRRDRLTLCPFTYAVIAIASAMNTFKRS